MLASKTNTETAYKKNAFHGKSKVKLVYHSHDLCFIRYFAAWLENRQAACLQFNFSLIEIKLLSLKKYPIIYIE